MELILVWLVSAVALMITAYIVPGFEIKSFGAALVTAIVLGLLNAVLWPLLILLTLPINMLTLGLFSFVISAAVLKLTAWVVTDLKIDGWGPAILGAVVLALINAVGRSLL